MKTSLLLLLPLFGYSQSDTLAPVIKLEIFIVNDSTATIQVTKPESVSDECVKEFLDLYFTQPKPKKRKYI